MYDNYLEWKNKPIEQPTYLSIIIPAYNESERIVPTIGAVASQVCDLGIEWELIIADDGSTDDTVSIAEDLELVNLRVLQAQTNGGKGSAVRRGMAAARLRERVGPYPPGQIPLRASPRSIPLLYPAPHRTRIRRGAWQPGQGQALHPY